MPTNRKNSLDDKTLEDNPKQYNRYVSLFADDRVSSKSQEQTTADKSQDDLDSTCDAGYICV